ncbi:MAG: AMP-binding protein, partial [Betaproteobacteria bacterium]|nr:AMP-binding protein [Betaproteobacteria bacterium]
MEKIWLRSYPEGVPAEIDIHQFRSLGELFEKSCAQYRERVAYINMDVALTYGDLDRLSRDFAAYLQQVLQLPKGARIALMLPNLLQYPICMFGALRAGYVVVNCNPLYTHRELEHQLRDAGAEAIVIVENFAHTLEQALPALPQLKHVMVTGLGDLLGFSKGAVVNFMVRHVKKMVPTWSLPGHVRLKDALARGRNAMLQPVAVGHEDIAFLQYTGGTTGVAKGAMLTHRNIVANCLQAKAWSEGQMQVDEIETILTPLPLYHIYSLTANCLIFMGIGGRNILLANPRDTKRVMKIIKNEHFTSITSVNTLFASFLDNPEFRKRDFSKLKMSMAGGMAMHKSVADRWKQLTGNDIVEGYGLTECSPIVTINPVDLKNPRPYSGSIGVPVPSTEVRMRREDGSWA